MKWEKNKKAFTLIELLVVIAIIALLLAIVLPALKKVKESAWMKICQSNMRQNGMAAHSFATDNNDALPRSITQFRTEAEAMANGVSSNDAHLYSDSWACWPIDATGAFNRNVISGPFGGGATVDERIRGIEHGTLWDYLGTPEAYHCPKDKRMEKGNGGFRSYAFTRLINDTASHPGRFGPTVKTVSRISNPSTRLMLVEEADPRGWNFDSWIFNEETGVSVKFHDPIAYWHGNGSLLVFADGHAEHYVFKEIDTIKWLQFIERRAFNGDGTKYGYGSYSVGGDVLSVKDGIDNEDCQNFAIYYGQ